MIASVVLLFAVLAVVVFFFLPHWVVDDSEFKMPAARLKAENDIRTIGIQFLGGAVLALGALFTAINVVFNRESHITGRFTRAVDQLGHKERDIRVGGIYALERIARDSRRDHEPVMEILTTYVKEHAPAPPAGIVLTKPFERPPADIRAALTALGRRITKHEREPFFIELSETLLTRADLSGGDFSGSAFIEAHPKGANLIDADLSQTALIGAHLEEATLKNTNLRDSWLEDAHCRQAEFWGGGPPRCVAAQRGFS